MVSSAAILIEKRFDKHFEKAVQDVRDFENLGNQNTEIIILSKGQSIENEKYFIYHIQADRNYLFFRLGMIFYSKL